MLRPNELAVELDAGASRLTDVMGTVRLRYARVFGFWAVGGAIRGGEGVQHTAYNDVTLSELGLEATCELRAPLGRMTLSVGGGGAIDGVLQHVARTDGAHASPPFETTSNFTASAIGPIAVARLRQPLGLHTWIELAVRGELLVSELDGTPGLLWTALGGFAAGITF